ncbi:MAG: hypothetical protein OQL06_15235 [Gammaproteobacteria bacterium]|nr:hypothetical protein [Gammaproteobacteria bacterium]
MLDTFAKKTNLPFNCRMLCVSLIGGSLALVIIFLFFYMDYISIEVAIGISMGLFVMLGLYESFLVSLVARRLFKDMDKKIKQ